jgi:hypothetical protein
MEPFDKNGLFRELIRNWSFARKDHEKEIIKGKAAQIVRQRTEEAKEAWNAVVHDQLLADAVFAHARRVREELEPNSFPPSLASLIRSTVAEPAEAPPPPAAAPRAPTPKPVAAKIDAVTEAFEDVWSRWAHSDLYPEGREGAASAFREAVRLKDLPSVVWGCNTYIESLSDPGSGLSVAFNLRHFLTKGPKDDDHTWCEVYAYRASRAPDADAVAYFEVTWAWYPDFQGRDERTKREARDFYLRHVPAPERFAFLCAVKAFREERRLGSFDEDEQERFTQGFIRFLPGWKSQKWYPIAAYAILRAFYQAFRDGGLPAGFFDEHWAEGCMRRLFQTQGPTHDVYTDTFDRYLQRQDALEWAPEIRASVEKIRPELPARLQAACQATRQPPRSVVHSS